MVNAILTKNAKVLYFNKINTFARVQQSQLHIFCPSTFPQILPPKVPMPGLNAPLRKARPPA